MNRTLSLWLAITLMMFPQIAETIYSPALTDIADGFNVAANKAGQTLSLYFFAFALGVIIWGRLCDVIGRRPTMLAGLFIYTLACIGVLMTNDFSVLLLLRMLSAFGAAVGSVGTQTIIRDVYSGHELAKVFSMMGAAIALSPAIGMLSGSLLVRYAGYQGVFSGLASLAVILLLWSLKVLPETRSQTMLSTPTSLRKIAIKMLSDKHIIKTLFLIAFFNISLFAYYQLAPFMFEKQGYSPSAFGYSGFALALGVSIGSYINKALLNHQWQSHKLVLLASIIAVFSAIGTYLLRNELIFIIPMIASVIAYGIAIPNILATALARYKYCLGTAGALLGFFYYFLIAGGLALAGWGQDLAITLIMCSIGSFFIAYFYTSTSSAH
ncbi:multidrug effflux MFS transporter [Proteus myxofaciens]|uniref:Bcr/CflA family efflux transporter n=1 Tax=Proteus myxofaciens ATCC 19692 TaxID=1354337 RepID=A0A198FJC8_9GAMM|nr:multidrug effflux MFS transporter [Proteus myxofaciens]OAT24306.1 multidrug resistance protein D [Proteus myxofaciens ATCC 19692]